MHSRESQLLSANDLALLLDIPLRTIYQWRYVGSGPPAAKLGRHLRYRRCDVESWIQAQIGPVARPI